MHAVKEVISNPIVQVVAAIVVAPYVGFYIGTTFGLSTAAGYAVSGFTAGFIASGGDLRAGLVGAATAMAFYGVGNLAQGGWNAGQTALAHGGVGGVSNMAMGGSFKDGFLSGGFTSLASPVIGTVPGGRTAHVVAAAVVGGTAAELGGGKFANGAATGAFSRLFNGEAHDDGGRYESRRVGDSIYRVRVFQCATAECVAMGANLDIADSGTQAYLSAVNAEMLSDVGTAASLVILKTPVSALGNAAARTSLAADMAKTMVTGNPANLIPTVTGRFAQGVAETSLGATNAATVNRIGAGAGLVIDQVVDPNGR